MATIHARVAAGSTGLVANFGLVAGPRSGDMRFGLATKKVRPEVSGAKRPTIACDRESSLSNAEHLVFCLAIQPKVECSRDRADVYR